MLLSTIDTTFDCRSDAGGKDPDRASPTLRRFHRLLWSKRLPDGRLFDLNDSTPGAYLRHESDIGVLTLTSDSVMPTYTRWKSMRHITECLSPEENEEFRRSGYTMGGMMVFPGNRIDRKPTLNRARGFSRIIADRMDLALECIRRYYLDEDIPLGPTLRLYSDFFALFGSFRGYVEFFLLQDMVAEDFNEVRFFLPLENFSRREVPADSDSYLAFRQASMTFMAARNRRINAWVATFTA